MRNPKLQFKEGGYPKGDDLLLLKAALCPLETALPSWEKWLEKHQLETDVHLDAYRLLPLIFENLQGHFPMPPGVEGAYKKTFFINHQFLRHLLKSQKMLAAAGIETIVMKGMALVISELSKPGARFQFDYDMLVPYERRLEAVSIFERAGFKPYFEGGRVEHLATSHSVGFVLPEMAKYGSFDVHWFPVAAHKHRRSNDLFFGEKIEVTFNGSRFLTLPPELLLLQTILHGLKIHHVSHVQWVADAALILKNAPAFDWQKMAHWAAALEGGFWVKNALQFLATLPEVPVFQGLETNAAEFRHGFAEPFAFRFFNREKPGIADLFFWKLRERRHLSPEKSTLAHVNGIVKNWRENREDLDGWAFLKLAFRRAGHLLGNISPNYRA